MQRIALSPRAGWQQTVERQGLTFHSPAGMAPQPYWDESAAYQLSAAEVDTLEAAANELQTMCLAAAQHVIDRGRFAELAIPAAAVPLIEWAWEQEPPSIYGRFDVSWGGAQTGSPPKLLEYNADTPTSLLEAAVIQWTWLEECATSLKFETNAYAGEMDQFNSLHERLIARWKEVAGTLKQPVYFAALEAAAPESAEPGSAEPGSAEPDPAFAREAAEDLLTVTYLRDTAEQAGLTTRHIALQDIGWSEERNCFVDADFDENTIESLFKLYPWEAMLVEEFGPAALATYGQMSWIEPIWKMLLSNKGILPILWELYPDHPLLLPAYFENGAEPGGLTAYARKPLQSREGANISLVQPNATTVSTAGPYGDGPFIRQALAPRVTFATAGGEVRYPVLGLWMIDQECGGMGIRESSGPVTDNLSSFVPHFFV